jgi:ComF family protein
MAKRRYIFLIDSVHKYWVLFLNLIFPIECFGCEREDTWLCSECFNKIIFRKSQSCLDCKTENQWGEFCNNCCERYYLDGVWIAADYEQELVAKLIKSYKYHFVKDISLILAKILIQFLDGKINETKNFDFKIAGLDWKMFDQIKARPKVLLDFQNNLIMPVPLSKKRLKWRGFNQAEIIANILADNFKLEIDAKNLKRIKNTKPQAKLNERERRNNLADCFSWLGDKLNGRNIILVDDVATTGSTLNECAKVLKQAGASEVWGLVVANG